MAIKKAKIITITSVKGGVGKSTFTVFLAGLIEKRKLKTLIIDLDLYASAIALALDLKNEKDIYTLANDIRNNQYKAFEDYVTKYDSYIDVLPSIKDPRYASKISNKYIDMIIDKASTRYDVILIDTNHLLIDTNLITLDASEFILYLITSDIFDLKNMRTMVNIYNDMEKDNYSIILNRAIGEDNYSTYEVEHIIDSNIDYTISKDMYIKNLNNYIIEGKIPSLDNKILKKAHKTVLELDKMLDKLLER